MTSHPRAGGPVPISLRGGFVGKEYGVNIGKKRKRAVIGEFIVLAEQSIPARLETKIEWMEVFLASACHRAPVVCRGEG